MNRVYFKLRCYIEDWWANSVKEIYTESLKLLNDNEDLLTYGPSHIVWEDSNFDDECIKWCIEDCSIERWKDRFSQKELDIVRQSLEKLLLIPEHVRDCNPNEVFE
jgi:hypothetical protein